MGFSTDWKNWSGLPFPSPGNRLDPGINLASLMSPAVAGGFFTTSTTWEALVDHCMELIRRHLLFLERGMGVALEWGHPWKEDTGCNDFLMSAFCRKGIWLGASRGNFLLFLGTSGAAEGLGDLEGLVPALQTVPQICAGLTTLGGLQSPVQCRTSSPRGMFPADLETASSAPGLSYLSKAFGFISSGGGKKTASRRSVFSATFQTSRLD